MKFTRNGSIQIIAGVLAGAGALVTACGGDDATVDDGTPDAGADTGGSTSSSSGATSSTSSSGGSTSSGGTDGGGTDAAKEAGGDGGKVPLGGDCKAPVDCESGVCFVGGKDSYCTIKCTMLDDEDPVCEALKGDFNGDCNKQGFCRKEN